MSSNTHLLPLNKVENLLSHSTWDNIYFEYIHNSTNEEICLLVSAIFFYFSPDLINPIKIQKVVQFICSTYNNNLYHDWKHGSHVFVNAAFILSRIVNDSLPNKDVNENMNIEELNDSISSDFDVLLSKNKRRLSKKNKKSSSTQDISMLTPLANSPFQSIERFAYLYSALIHDAGHLGVSNSALVEKEHPLSLLYHHQSVAEMHSLSIGLNIFLKSENLETMGILSEFSTEQKKIFRSIVIDVVLSTDIADPFKKFTAYHKLEKYSNPDGKLILNSNDSNTNFCSKVSLLSVLIRCADIGSSFQNVQTSIYWAKRFYMETSWAFYCGDGPKNENVSCYNSQILFLKFHAISLLEKLEKTQCIDKIFFKLLMKNVQNNKSNWEKRGNEYLVDWESSSEIQEMTSKSMK